MYIYIYSPSILQVHKCYNQLALQYQSTVCDDRSSFFIWFLIIRAPRPIMAALAYFFKTLISSGKLHSSVYG